ncbi:thioredoxin family protein [Teredinibacter sp. KSP-S5-2]|uniref:thioredoxin family protein n=1 Tax=Teredinibacter sp. KSP-S5-2 TaxID=3034506 RepID=UPI002934D8D0|nr:thioredoxin family protein [Teredinibacter sp. KSP-S5-2]WNO10682.1 thioredoxin family protein [Teredinibacter sp. KSP-S5-2]
MKIKVLGSGCKKCEHLAELTEMAAKELGIDYELEKVKDPNEITAHGVMMTPALVIDEEVKVTGKIPSLEELKNLLK